MTVGSRVEASPFAVSPRLWNGAAPCMVLAGTLALYAGLHAVLLAVSAGSSADCVVLDAATTAAAVLFAGLRYSEIPAPLLPLMRGIAAVVLVQVAFDTSTLLYGPASMLSGMAGAFFLGGSAIAIAAGFAALWRPSFVLPLLCHYVAFRHQLNIVSGIAVSETDYLSMLDVGFFVAVGALVAIGLARSERLRAALPSEIDARELVRQAGMLIWVWAVGAHLGNYFISGWTKIRAGGSEPLFWLLHNPTQTSIMIGLERGDNMLAAWPALVQASWDAIVAAGVGLNLFVLGVQILAPLALTHRRVLMAFTVMYDLFHIAVLGTLGAFFFFWIAVNVLVYLSARRIDDKAMTPTVKLVGLVSVLTAHVAFYTSHLGWLDGAKLASPSFVAETRDGRTVPVPSVYFGIMSYSIAQTAMYIPEGHFPMRLGGNTYNRTDWRDAQTCGGDTAPNPNNGVPLATVENMVRQNDAAMRRNPVVKADNLYYLYPHHMVANPLMFADFNRLSIDDIVGYRYVVESVCLSLKDGMLVRDVRKRTEYPIDAGH